MQPSSGEAADPMDSQERQHGTADQSPTQVDLQQHGGHPAGQPEPSATGPEFESKPADRQTRLQTADFSFWQSSSSNVNFSKHIILSCFVFWCCGCFFGLVAFLLASECTRLWLLLYRVARKSKPL